MPVEAYRRHLKGKTKIIKCTILIFVKNLLCSLLFLFAKDRRLISEKHEALKHWLLIIYKKLRRYVNPLRQDLTHNSSFSLKSRIGSYNDRIIGQIIGRIDKLKNKVQYRQLPKMLKEPKYLWFHLQSNYWNPSWTFRVLQKFQMTHNVLTEKNVVFQKVLLNNCRFTTTIFEYFKSITWHTMIWRKKVLLKKILTQ